MLEWLYRLCIDFKRLGEDMFFSGAFVVFRHISAIFRVFCLVILGNFVNLPTEL